TVDIAEGESVHLRVLRTGKPIRGAALRVGPAKRQVVVNGAPIYVQGQLQGSVGVIHDVSEIYRLSRELAEVKTRIRYLEARHTFDDIVGESAAIRRAKDLALRAARTPVTVLLSGESGTGKELFAHAIHHASDRSDQPFIRVNCAAIPKDLLESELFGYEEGAFSGARKGGRKGHFEEADGGTLFLDEIAEAPLPLQSRLLRTLQEREVVRVGSSRPHHVDVRLIAATNGDLAELVERGEFRQDLYYRLNVMSIHIPPLRERPEDIPGLAAHLLDKISNDYFQRTLKDFAPETVAFLQRQPWPGNVRELENAIGRALICVQAEDPAIEPVHLVGSAGTRPPPAAGPASAYAGGSYAELKDAWEKELLQAALGAHGGNRTAAAKALGISIRAFYYKMEHHGLA
ncbi:MAG: sigma-54 interaction domain-containing protein, partial [Deferrisomatales bacterium]